MADLDDPNSIDLKRFLSDPPPIQDMSAVLLRPRGTNFIPHSYWYLRWQEGDFVTLLSRTNRLVLKGMTDQTDGSPQGFGKFGDWRWFFWGNSRFIAIQQHEGVLTNAPEEFQNWLSQCRSSPVNKLLSFGCLLAPPGAFCWDEDWAHLSLTNEDAEIDAQIIMGSNGRIQELRYGIQPSGSKTRGTLPAAFWLYEYEYGAVGVPASLPCRITRSYVTSKHRIVIDRIEIHRLVFAKEPMIRKDFQPEQFLSPNATLKSAMFTGDSKHGAARTFLFVLCMVLATGPLFVFVASAYWKMKK